MNTCPAICSYRLRETAGKRKRFAGLHTLRTHNDRALCRCGIRIPSARNRCPAFYKDKYLEPMIGDVGQARTKPRICRTDDLIKPQAAFTQNRSK